MTNIVKVPGINGLGKTKSTKNSAELIIKDFQTISLTEDNIKTQQERIYKEALKHLDKKTIFIGGDHSISYPILKAFNKKYKNPFIIIFDAHADCMPPMPEPTHEEWLRALIEKENFPTENIILIGARNVEPEENGFLEEHKIKQFSVKEIEESLDQATHDILIKLEKNPTYISFDIDVFDSSIVPATGYPEEDGPEKQTILALLQSITNEANIKAADLVEIHINHSESDLDKTVHVARQVLEILKG
jgi:arginase family enzyme